MKKGTAIFFPRRDNEVVPFISNAAKQILLLADKYNLSQEEIDNLQELANLLPQTISDAEAASNIAQQKTVIKRDTIDASRKDYMRVFRQIQDSPNFKEEHAELIGFRVQHAKPDIHEMKPIVSKITPTLENIIIEWVKNGMDGAFVYGSYDGELWQNIGRDTRSPYEDERKNQTSQPEDRYYKLRYIINDKPVGIESDVVKVLAEVY